MSTSHNITTTEGTMQEEYDRLKIQEAKKRLLEPDDNPVDHPSHYQSMSSKVNIECIDAMRAAFGDYETAIFCRCNAFKYIWRADSKGGNEDIEKAQYYLNKFLELGGCDQ